jgi:hypothetical protein
MGKLSSRLHKQMEKQMMNPMEILQYSPRKGDVIIYNDGTYTEILTDMQRGNPSVKGSFHALGVEPSEISVYVPMIRNRMIQGKCHLCRKEIEDVQDNTNSDAE